MKTIVLVGISAGVGLVVGEMIDAQVGPSIEGKDLAADKKRITLRKGVKIGTQAAVTVGVFGILSRMV